MLNCISEIKRHCEVWPFFLKVALALESHNTYFDIAFQGKEVCVIHLADCFGWDMRTR